MRGPIEKAKNGKIGTKFPWQSGPDFSDGSSLLRRWTEGLRKPQRKSKDAGVSKIGNEKL